jgi:hypothetical protein
MAGGTSVLLLDDGELDDIQEALDEIGAAYARVRGGAIVDGTRPPTDLLIATPRRIEAVAKVEGSEDGPNPLRLVVVSEDSTGLREQLRRSGFDYLIRRPVHPEALRLLLLRGLYRGDERRREPRVAVGFEVNYRAGLRSRRAVLADLSTRGCRLISADPLAEGRRIRVNIPEAAESGRPVAISGRVLRVDRLEDVLGEPDRYGAAILFENLEAAAASAVELLIEDLALGPATLRGLDAPPLDPDLETDAGSAEMAPGGSDDEIDGAIEVDLSVMEGSGDDQTGDRRGGRRAAYVKTVPAFGKRALRVLVGRDLAVGGMRIDPLPGLQLGDRLHLAIYGEAGESPFLVWATVHRDDGERGMALAFDTLPAEVAKRLERLVGSLPAVESLHDSEVQAMGTVMSEILPG